MTFKFSVTPEESHVIAYCCSCYLDNENDKGREGIGNDLMEQVQDMVLYCGNGDGDELPVTWQKLAQMKIALETYKDDEAIEEAIAAHLMRRIDSIFPQSEPEPNATDAPGQN